jgi:hypothetical protein
MILNHEYYINYNNKMDITLVPDIYTPSVDNNGNYIDNIPIIRNGITCQCGTRKNKIYDTNSKFTTHSKTKKHQKWLTILNQNKANYYVETIKMKELIENQQKIIARLENQLQNKSMTIDYLTKQLILQQTPHNIPVANLLDLN